MDINKLITRAKNIILTPKTEWPVIAQEQTDIAGLYTGYVMIMAAIPAVFGLLANVIFSPLGIVFSFITMLLSYALALGMVFVMGLIIDALAPSFGAQKNQMQAMKTAAYYGTPGWVAGVFQIIPVLGALIMLAAGIYGLFQLYFALPHTMKVPQEKAVGYTVVIVVVAILLSLLVMGILGAIAFMAVAGTAALR
ncbi:Yip1 family protein [Tahibacter harae]|uniref:YIP1 family protein n=1 Tax=Tahibacter harae TaxID=2963937 RepID=A0ABT1QQL1_9GAMM|nr:Yip1 family protein [Tahibacter harae]MCQ4164562.1 YIP1 family protein [Tahibacter harae]